MIVSFGMYWQVYGRQQIVIPDGTENIEDYIRDNWKDIPLPAGDYVTGSDELDEESIIVERN